MSESEKNLCTYKLTNKFETYRYFQIHHQPLRIEAQKSKANTERSLLTFL